MRSEIIREEKHRTTQEIKVRVTVTPDILATRVKGKNTASKKKKKNNLTKLMRKTRPMSSQKNISLYKRKYKGA